MLIPSVLTSGQQRISEGDFWSSPEENRRIQDPPRDVIRGSLIYEGVQR